MIRKILVATDGSRVAKKAVHYTAGLARQMGASVTLLGVIDLMDLIARGTNPVMMPSKILMETQDLLKQATAEHLDEAMTAFKKMGLRVRKAIRTGYAVDEIIKEARKSKSDLIVLGSRGRSVLKAAVLGSVAYGVIHKDANIPILIVRK